eukprot:5368064-Amphidinium_carterae.1
MSLCVPLSRVEKERTMHTMTIRKRIQEQTQNDKYETPPGLAHLPPGGHYVFHENDVQYLENMPQKGNRT